jgi:hypothetical protein
MEVGGFDDEILSDWAISSGICSMALEAMRFIKYLSRFGVS